MVSPFCIVKGIYPHMDPFEYEKRAREKRCALAATKNLVGPEGKIGTILRYFGEKIWDHGGDDGSVMPFEGDSNTVLGMMYTSTPGIDAWLLDEPPEEAKNAVDMTNRMPTMGAADVFGNDTTEPEGKEWTTRKTRTDGHSVVYQGDLFFEPKQPIGMFWDGLRMGIHMEIKYIEERQMLTVHWKGYLVYQEVAGDLRTYIPSPEWESKIDKFYLQARPKALAAKKKAEEIEQVTSKEAEKGFFRRILERWGPNPLK